MNRHSLRRPGRSRQSHRTLRRPVRIAGRAALAMTAVAALLSVDVPDASAAPGPGTTLVAAPGGVADRVGTLFAGGTDGGHFCTASVVHSADRDVIATAAHCLGDVDATVFVPGYRDGATPYGVWRLTGAEAAPAWTEAEDPDADVAFATVAPLDGRRIEDVVGGFPVAPDQPADAVVTVLGYPSSRESPLSCTNETSLWSPAQRRIECPDLSGGTSGSPWLVDGALAGVLGGHEGGGTDPDVSYSAVLGLAARELLLRADGRSSEGSPCRKGEP
ncbi:serine protease [Streptomyces sp. NPDC089799]|uniref:trypsin-like serine peptidase n=1 Tax=Streptomyces sp. NPDC089799 TaxID=3155066 RepID=UPI00341BD605